MKYIVLFLSFWISLSCSDKPKEVAAATAEQPFTLADRAYCDKVEESLEAWADADFETWASYFADEINFYAPRGPMEEPFDASLETIEERAKWYRDWFKFREITDVGFTSLSSIAIMGTNEVPYFDNSGISVITHANMQMSIYGQPMVIGMNLIHHFNDDGKIDKLYYIYDFQNQLDALNY